MFSFLKFVLFTNFLACFALLTNLTCSLFRMFSIVFPKTELFISLKKPFSNSDFVCVLIFVFKSIYGLSKLLLSNFIPL